MTTKRKLWIVVVAGLILVVGSLVGIKAGQIGAMIALGQSMTMPPESVTTTQAQTVKWRASRAAIGTLVAVRSVSLASELAGLVREIGFESGSHVRKGAMLVRLDTSQEEAQLRAAEAEAALANLSLDRARNLRQAGSSSPAELDAAVARAKQAVAAVASLEAIIAKKTIRAPFDGKITIRQVELGQVVQGGTPVATLHSVTPIHADFWLPQQALSTLAVGQETALRTDTFPGAAWNGKITVVNPEVDPATRNVRVRATFDNLDGKLKPGMFANVEVVGKEERSAVIVPATAVLFAPYGDSVFVAEQAAADPAKGQQGGTIAKQRIVRLGERRGDFVEVVDGLRTGETVVSAGAFKLRNGMAIVARNGRAPEAELAPAPVDR
jgi:membrane fusion protein (multidrug efflux system)